MGEMRLINANELKKAVENLVVGGAEGLKDYYENGSKSDENSWIGGVYAAWELIDNAPTVNLDKTSFMKGYNYGCDDGKRFYERPKGEWKLVSNINNNIDVVCPFCNKTRIFSYAHGYSIEEVKSQLQEVNDLPNYCENCGADMRGGDKE